MIRSRFVGCAGVGASLLLFVLIGGCASEGGVKYATGKKTDRRAAEDPPKCPVFDAQYRDQFKSCAVDDDCEAVPIEVTCAGSVRLYGVARADVDQFSECVPAFPSRTCAVAREPARAEDGRVSRSDAFEDVAARCIEGRCRAQIEERTCGEAGAVCTGGQLCVAWQTEGFDPEFACADDPCAGAELDCECAQPLCQGRTDALRMCVIDRVTDSDVYCQLVRR